MTFPKLSIFFLLFALTSVALAGDRVAIVREVQGTVTSGDKQVTKYQTLSPGQTVLLSSDAVLVVDYLKSGLRQSVNGEVKLEVGENRLLGAPNIKEQKSARFEALSNIGAQKKIGGSATRIGSASDIRVTIKQGEQGPQFMVGQGSSSVEGSYYVVLSETEGGPLGWGWERASLKESPIPIPPNVLQELKPGVRYTILVGKPGDYQSHRGHRLRFQKIPSSVLRELERLRVELRDSPEGLLNLMEIYNSLDMVAEARDVGRTLLEHPLPQTQKDLVRRAVENLTIELEGDGLTTRHEQTSST